CIARAGVKKKHQFCTAWYCFAVQRASPIRGAHYDPASRRGGGSKARWQFAASGLFLCLQVAGSSANPREIRCK
ncbi:hypothetical protein, partial [Xanthomonas euvesicatoria]|uniref:hypothetical protein n=1 Tax=Xanthomonas euvesicatoria TaxID=456327 RepID=UPI001B80909A